MEACTSPTRIRPGPLHRPGPRRPRASPEKDEPEEGGAASRGLALLESERDESRRRDDEERHAVDGGDGGDLDHGKVAVLAVSEQTPRELEEGVDAQQLGADPQERSAQEGPPAEGRERASQRPREQRREEGDGQAQRGHDPGAHGEGQPAVLNDDERRPVEEAEGGHGPRHVAEPDCPPPRRAGEGEEKGHERDPGHHPVPEPGEGQHEQHPGSGSQPLPPEATA
jgi:hypothetical protein